MTWVNDLTRTSTRICPPNGIYTTYKFIVHTLRRPKLNRKIIESLFERNLELSLKANYSKYTYMGISIQDQYV